MGIGFASWSLFLIHLLIFMCVHGSGARELTRKHSEEIHAMDDHPVKQHHDIRDQGTKREHVHAHPSSHMDDMDPSSMVFFTMKDQMVGETMPIYFRKRDFSTSPRLLPREEVDSIPFSLKQLPNLLEFFSFSPGSPQANSMEYTLRQCETEPIKGETKICATSMESLLDFTRGILGSNSDFQVLTTSHLTKSNTLFQNYTFLKMPEEILVPRW
ncbi:hypothetical protein I3842_05G063200 [Carya illinoinensis]|uniref:BURP domain-containing protein n=1 Tax=Carya illinoinensis TaxID=32201 RepID=A0A922JNQ6_CARIL|nr:hypothetical protein I3842_05G063200 [Carya illinoinensis]